MALFFLATGLLVAGLGARVSVTDCAGERCVVSETTWAGERRVELSRDQLDRVVVTLDKSGCRVDFYDNANGVTPVSTRFRECGPRHTQNAASLEAWRRGLIPNARIAHDERVMAYGVLVGSLFVSCLLMLNGYARTLVLDAERLVDTRLGSLGLGRTVTTITRDEIAAFDGDGVVHLVDGQQARLTNLSPAVLTALRHALASRP